MMEKFGLDQLTPTERMSLAVEMWDSVNHLSESTKLGDVHN
jgi:hypothetical protein